MQYIHVKNLEKYHPGYQDRNLIWCKIYFSMINGDAEFQLLHELDQWRFVKFIMLELQNKKPIPLDEEWLKSKGIFPKNRPINMTVNMLHNFVEVCNDFGEKSDTCSISISTSSLGFKEGIVKGNHFNKPTVDEIRKYCEERQNKIDPQYFFDKNESTGWVVGKHKTPMKDWRATIRTWEKYTKKGLDCERDPKKRFL